MCQNKLLVFLMTTALMFSCKTTEPASQEEVLEEKKEEFETTVAEDKVLEGEQGAGFSLENPEEVPADAAYQWGESSPMEGELDNSIAGGDPLLMTPQPKDPVDVLDPLADSTEYHNAEQVEAEINNPQPAATEVVSQDLSESPQGVNSQDSDTLGAEPVLADNGQDSDLGDGMSLEGLESETGPDNTDVAGLPEFETLHFGTNKSFLSRTNKSILDSIANELKSNTELKLEIAGHTDNRGKASYNKYLGLKRAKSVKRHLVRLGVSPKQLSVVSFGEESPLLEGNTPEAWKKNRRVEFTVVQGEKIASN